MAISFHRSILILFPEKKSGRWCRTRRCPILRTVSRSRCRISRGLIRWLGRISWRRKRQATEQEMATDEWTSPLRTYRWARIWVISQVIRVISRRGWGGLMLCSTKKTCSKTEHSRPKDKMQSTIQPSGRTLQTSIYGIIWLEARRGRINLMKALPASNMSRHRFIGSRSWLIWAPVLLFEGEVGVVYPGLDTEL